MSLKLELGPSAQDELEARVIRMDSIWTLYSGRPVTIEA